LASASRRSEPVPRLWLRHVLLAVAALCAAFLAVAVYETGALNVVELASVDARFSVRGTQLPATGIVIVAVDQKTLADLDERFPIPRVNYAQLLDRVRAGHPRLIGLDVVFDGTTDTIDDDALLGAVARDGPVLLATQDEAPPIGVLPVPAGVRDARGAVLASAAVETDSDGVLRHMIYAAVKLPTFAVVAAEMLDRRPVSTKDFPRDEAWVGFQGPPGTFPAYSMSDVLKGRVHASSFADKIVLIGVTDPVGKDLWVTAESSAPMSGVEFQANALSTILRGFPLKSVSSIATVALLFLLAAVPSLLTLRWSSLAALAGAVGVLLLFLAGAQIAFDRGAIVDVPSPVVALALGTGGAVAVESFVQRKQLRELQTVLDLLPRSSDFFLSYRRGQSELAANTLREGLARKFGTEHVFMDVDAIQPGEQWPQRIQEAIDECRAMLVVIGPQWLATLSPSGGRRLDDPSDFVRREVAAGLARQEAVLVPVLHDGASPPGRDELPEALKALADCQAVQLTGRDFDRWIDDLAENIRRGRARQHQYLSQASGGPESEAKTSER
jgi:CHASE2 domain-containing sensor protein